MKFVALVSAFLLPVVTLAYGPSPLLADDGRDLSFLLKRYDGPAPILHRAVKGKRHIIPRTLQSSPDDGYAVYSKCLDAAYVPCPDGSQCCPAGYVCGPGSCCPAGNLVCTGNCEDRSLVSSPSSSLTHKSFFRLPRCPRRLLPERWVLPSWTSERVHAANNKAISDSVFHRSASLRLMEPLGAALVVKHVLPPPVSGHGKNKFGLLLNLNPPRMRRSYSCGVPWRELLLSSWYHLFPRCSPQCGLSQSEW